jgi:hypothetical protein
MDGAVRWAAHWDPTEWRIAPQQTRRLVLKAVALGMATVCIVLGFSLEAADISTQVTLLYIRPFALALSALEKEDEQGENI